VALSAIYPHQLTPRRGGEPCGQDYFVKREKDPTDRRWVRRDKQEEKKRKLPSPERGARRGDIPRGWIARKKPYAGRRKKNDTPSWHGRAKRQRQTTRVYVEKQTTNTTKIPNTGRYRSDEQKVNYLKNEKKDRRVNLRTREQQMAPIDKLLRPDQRL